MGRILGMAIAGWFGVSCGGEGTTCGPGTTLEGSMCVVTETATDASSCTKVMMYPDKDGDGFGAALEAAVAVCPGTAGFAGNNMDCADGDARAHPGQSSYFGTPITGLANVMPYDFNCDSKIEVQYPSFAQCSVSAHPAGWQGENIPLPACGETGALNVTACEELSTKQACR